MTRLSSRALVLLSAAAALAGAPGALAGPNAAGLKFLAENKEKEGGVTLASGLQYKVLRKGDGTHHPTVDSPCETHYEGTLIDGTVFDSSYKRGSPTTFAPNQVIKGWTEAMQLMVEGDKWELYIPSDLAYGDRGSPPKIGGGDTLIFQMEIINIKGGKVPALTCKVSGDGCNERELKYLKKQQAKDLSKEKLSKEIDRIGKMKSKKIKPSLKQWMDRRINILSQMKDEL